MTLPARVPGKCGLRAPSNKPAIRFGDILRAGATIPPHPDREDYLAALSDWQMLGNDQAGDCVAVTWANFRRLVTAVLGARENYPTQDAVWQIYRTQNPGFDPQGTADTNGPGSAYDQGMDIQTLLEYLVKHGGPDGVKAVAFAKVDYTNLDELKAADAIFGGVWSGIEVTDVNEQEFSEGKPWDYDNHGEILGGHSVLIGGYTPQQRFITWAAETEFTDAFVKNQVEEAWIVVWPEHLGTKQFEAGIDQAALAAAYQELTGRSFPVQPTPPAPQPTPTPGPSPADTVDEALAAVLRPWVTEHHIGENHRVQVAAKAWLAGKGLQ
jgi:hypothetical protein